MDGMDGMKTIALRIGRIVSVAGCQAVCVLERDAHGEVAPLQIGGLVKTNIGKSQVYGLVSGVSIPVPSAGEGGDPEMKVVELMLIGEATAPGPGRTAIFRRGVSMFPALGDAVYATSREDLVQVYAPPAAANISIGTLHHDRAVHAHALVDELLGKHFAVLGTTGSGKSCAAAVILRQIVTQNPNSHILLLDPHGEYPRAFGPRAEVITADTLELPFWMLNFEEILQIMFGAGTDPIGPEGEILSELIVGAKHDYAGGPQQSYEKLFSVDTPAPYRLSDLLTRLNGAMGKLDNTINIPPYRRIKQRVLALQYDPRFSFMFGGVQVRDRMAAILGRLFRLPAEGKPICILDLSSIPSEALPVVVAAMCRLAHSFASWSSRGVPAVARVRGSAPLRRAGARARLRHGQALADAHRQGRPQIRNLARRREPAALEALDRPHLPMQHDLRDAPLEQRGPAVPLGRLGRHRDGPERLPADAAHRRVHRDGPGRHHADPHALPRPARRRAPRHRHRRRHRRLEPAIRQSEFPAERDHLLAHSEALAAALRATHRLG